MAPFSRNDPNMFYFEKLDALRSLRDSFPPKHFVLAMEKKQKSLETLFAKGTQFDGHLASQTTKCS